MLFFSSCEREDAIKPSASNKKLQTTSVTVTDSKLEQKLQNTVVIGLLDLSENQYFRGMVHELVADTFDGDYNTLVKTIETAWNAKGGNFLNDFNASLAAHKSKFPNYPVFTTSDSIIMAVRGLVIDKKDTAYTQIYIPNFDNLGSNTGKPALAPGTFLLNTEKVPVLGIDPTNGGTVRSQDEAQANNEITWIATINETKGFFFDPNGNPGYTPPAPSNVNVGRREIRLVACRINDLNEAWINGDSEIQIYMKQLEPSAPVFSDRLYKPSAYWPAHHRHKTGEGDHGDYFRKLDRRDENEEWNYPDDNVSPWLATNMVQNPVGPFYFAEGNTLFFNLFELDRDFYPAQHRVDVSTATGYGIHYMSSGNSYLKYDFIYDEHPNSTDWRVIEIPVDGAYLAIKYRNF
jgi:hypothetical protein